MMWDTTPQTVISQSSPIAMVFKSGLSASVTTSRFGSGAMSRDSKGSTTTTQRFGDGTIKLHQCSGASATTSRFGSG